MSRFRPVSAMSPQQLADSLDEMVRLGTQKDSPEGSRYVQISDTLLMQIADRIREFRVDPYRKKG